MTTNSINSSGCSFRVWTSVSKYFSVVILDGISTTACILMASDCAHEEISVFVENDRFDQSVQLTFVFCWQQIPFPPSTESQDWWHPKSPEVILPENLAAHCVDDKPMAFLITDVAETTIKVCLFFLIRPTHLFIAENVAKTWLIGWLMSLRLQLKSVQNKAQNNERTNLNCF